MSNILSLEHEDARKFLLAGTSYCNFQLPPYFNFDKLIQPLSKKLKNKKYEDVLHNKKLSDPKKMDGINYHLFQNKDGKYEWRKLELMHPVLYILLVQEITEPKNWKHIQDKFKDSDDNSVVKCVSLPDIDGFNKDDKINGNEEKNNINKKNYAAEQITNWTKRVEQKSIELSLDYSYIYHTDIIDCYGSIYTHSIPWFLHTKEVAKEKREPNLLGNIIDSHLQAMSHGQTNGIPQGSILMDFISEMVLFYADEELSKKIQDKYKNEDEDETETEDETEDETETETETKTKTEYKIIRYKDDYKIFVNEPTVGDFIIKSLAEVLIDLRLKLRSDKTILSNDIIKSTIKKDKMEWLSSNRRTNGINNQLLVLYNFSLTNINSGTLIPELLRIFRNLERKVLDDKKKEKFLEHENIYSIIGIVVNIAYQNPKIYPAAFGILSMALLLLKEKESEKTAEVIAKKIRNKFQKIHNHGLIDIWLQRMTFKLDFIDLELKEKMCRLVSASEVEKRNEVGIWNNEWLKKEIIDVFDEKLIIDQKVIDEMPTGVGSKEVSIFKY